MLSRLSKLKRNAVNATEKKLENDISQGIYLVAEIQNIFVRFQKKNPYKPKNAAQENKKKFEWPKGTISR